MTDMPAWERRFRAPILSFPVLGRRRPGPARHGLHRERELPAPHVGSATGARRQVTDDPVGVLEGRPTRDGTGVIWFHDETGAESGSLRRSPRSTSGPAPSR